ncbi:uncharacterized protein K452DRAFT_293550 [Aplosporella prunicola CBS 121167]|uniref:Chromosome segregation ATPase family protein n=1 Tax=Aplosporella prunicola CBS 121167 TaxID=1176127 RepID=A0A6A6BTE3_9PEZI|nr:uncharacterized protein K452DRAFT_293550 [Aplosporella prunicola CBS 121167]KAF2147068.1 hypothetical protein K452DRAFT_293550 [Aplosporella prunicola CBS 121167]
MSSSRRGSTYDGHDMLVKHQNSFSSDGSRLNIPMWDSSDPERAPPPLPLHPGSPLTTRPNTSAAIASAAKALEEKARENDPAYTVNPMPPKSPERSLIKGAAHKRMQSLQDTSMRDFRSILHSTRSPDRSPERPGSRKSAPSPSPARDHDTDSPPISPDKTPSRVSLNPELLKDTPSLRPTSSRSQHKGIWAGENTPPSATMLALQAMPVRDHLEPPPPLNIPNSPRSPRSPRPSSRPRTPSSLPSRDARDNDGMSAQIREIATIAANLQREMTNLSRRSKDNAADLINLKEATNARDEDIRKSLKELVSNIGNQPSFPPPNPPFAHSRSNSFTAPGTPPTTNKTFSLPRISSPFFDERVGSPSPYSIEGAASVAMLEKIIREMVTKEGQDRLVNTLNGLFEKANHDSTEAAKKVGELVEFIKQGGSESRALITHGGDDSKSERNGSDSAGAVARATRDINAALGLGNDANTSKPYAGSKATEAATADLLKLLKEIQHSLSGNSGMTAEVKAGVRDIRGQVMGMGRDIARRFDDLTPNSSGALALTDGKRKEDIARIVREGLAELHDHMDNALQQNAMVPHQPTDNQEIYRIVKHALTEHGLNNPPPATEVSIDKDDLTAAVREAYEVVKPQGQLQQLGLERDEILDCLREGFEQHRALVPASQTSNISREDIMDAMADAMQHFNPPQLQSQAYEIREEVLRAVKECLDEFRPSMQVALASQSRDPGVTRHDVLDAVREGLETHGLNFSPELEISQEDLSNAMKATFEEGPFGGYSEQVLNRLQQLVNDMRGEFKAYSSANGRDTEQVLDAMKDGLEALRNEIESYVDRAQDVTGKDEIVDTVKSGLEALRIDVAAYVAAGPQGDQALNRSEMLDYIRAEFEHLQESMATQMIPSANGDKQEILQALAAGLDNLKTEIGNRSQEEPLNEEMQEAMKAEFDAVRDAILSGSASYRDEIMDTIHDSLDNLHDKLEAKLSAEQQPSQSSEDFIARMTDEFDHLRETLATMLVKTGGAEDKNDIIDAIREHTDGLRTQMAASQGESSERALEAVKGEIEQLRVTLGGTLVKSGTFEEKEEILEALRIGLESIKESQAQNARGDINAEVIEAIQVELEIMRKTIAGNMASRADTEEILETVRLGLDDLQSHMDKKIENPESQMRATGEILDALNDAVDGLRTDIGKFGDKPVQMDMSVNYEILDTLKEGIQSIHTEITRLKGDKQATVEDETSTTAGNEIVLAEDPETAVAREAPVMEEVSRAINREDMDKLEVILNQLHLKVESMDANMQKPAPEPAPAPAPLNEPAPGVALKADLAAVEELLKDVQAAVNLLSEDKHKDTAFIDGVAKKEDTDAIETLLQNTKAKLDDLILPDPETSVKKEHLEIVEAMVLGTSEAIDKLSDKIDGEAVASKGDIALVEVLVTDLKTAVDDLRILQPSEEEQAKKATKEDLDGIALLITDVKDKFASLPEAETVPSKAEIEQVVGLLNDFRDSHEKLKENYENDISVTAKAFDDRKMEAETIISNIGDVKMFLGEVKDEIHAKLQEGGEGVTGLKETVTGLEEALKGDFNVTEDVKQLLETVKAEFERAHGSIEDIKTDAGEKAQANLQKHDEVKEVIVGGMAEKLDEKFAEMMTKYDDMLVLTEAQAQKVDDKTAQQEEMMASTKATAEELKAAVDTLGTSITGMQAAFNETGEKMSGDSSNVTTKVEEAVTKMDTNHEADKAEHQLTRDEVAKVVTALTSVQEDLTENHPKFMVTLQEVLALVNQHYDHQRATQEAAHEQQRIAAEESKSRAEEFRESFFTKLPALLPAPPEPTEKYDDTQVHEKLDNLLDQAADASKSAEQLERLDEIHKQVMNTAAEVTQFVQTQTRLITEGHENREKEAEEVALLLERRTVQKEQIEQDIHNLNDEKDQLRQIVESLRHEKESLQAQKSKLNADVSALEMALNIRREELHHMDAKADALERRILNGIMDHSRALLMTKGIKAPLPGETVPRPPPPPSTVAKGVSMALNPRQTPRRKSTQKQANPANRRILSLSQINGNASPVDKGLNSTPNTGLKRSHSVKTQPGYRKASWSTAKRVASDANKENETLNEERESEDEDELDPSELGPSEVEPSETEQDVHSETGTERRRSYGSLSRGATEDPSMYNDSLVTTPSTERRTSYGAGSEYTYDTGSYLTGSDVTGSYLNGSDAGSTVHTSIETGTGIDEDHGEYYASDEDDDSHYEDDEGELTEVPREHEHEHEDGHGSDAEGSSVTGSALTQRSGGSASSASSEEVENEEEEHVSRRDSLQDPDSPESKKPEPAPAAEEPATTATTPTQEPESPPQEVASTTAPAAATTEAAMVGKKPPAATARTPAASDSGLGSDLPTAGLEGDQVDYFRRAAEEEASQVSGVH